MHYLFIHLCTCATISYCMKRIDISGLKSGYLMRFQIGIIVALATTLAAFNFTTYPPAPEEIKLVIVDDWEENIPITRHPKDKPKELPPPKIEMTEIIEPADDIEFIEKKPVELLETVVQPDETPVYVAPKPKEFKVIEKPPVVIEPDIVEPEGTDEVHNFTDVMPRFNACEDLDGSKEDKEKCALKALLAYAASNVKYPTIALENGIEGTVIVQFVVEKDGSISNAKVVRNIGGGLGKEALRVVKGMPKWIPGKQRSRPVRVKFTLPVKFQQL